MEHNTNPGSDSDPSMQKCIKCGKDKPIEQFVARTKAKQMTKWCSDCRYYGNAGHKRWAANKKLKTKSESSPPSQETVETARSPEGTQGSSPSQIPYSVYASPVYAPRVESTKAKGTQPQGNPETAHLGSSPEREQGPMPSQIPYRFYPSPVYAPYVARPSSKDTHSQTNAETAYFMGNPERAQVPFPSQIPHQVCHNSGYGPYMCPVPGAYSINRAPGNFQILTPSLNPPTMYPLMWGYGSPVPVMESPQWVAPRDFCQQSAVQKRKQSIARSSEVSASSRGSFDEESSRDDTSNDGTSSDATLHHGASHNEASQDGSAVHAMPDNEAPDHEGVKREISQKASSVRVSPEVHRLKHEPDDSNEEKEEVDERLHGETRQDFPEDPESFTAPYFICVACNTARPTRLEDSGICVYCFEHPTQYCIKGGHEDDRICFVDSDGRWHETCNRCRPEPDPT